MIRAKRIGRFKGVWRVVDEDDNPVTESVFFCYRRARKAALQYQAQANA